MWSEEDKLYYLDHAHLEHILVYKIVLSYFIIIKTLEAFFITNLVTTLTQPLPLTLIMESKNAFFGKTPTRLATESTWATSLSPTSIPGFHMLVGNGDNTSWLNAFP